MCTCFIRLERELDSVAGRCAVCTCFGCLVRQLDFVAGGQRTSGSWQKGTAT